MLRSVQTRVKGKAGSKREKEKKYAVVFCSSAKPKAWSFQRQFLRRALPFLHFRIERARLSQVDVIVGERRIRRQLFEITQGSFHAIQLDGLI
jgi:hypothetical protein